MIKYFIYIKKDLTERAVSFIHLNHPSQIRKKYKGIKNILWDQGQKK